MVLEWPQITWIVILAMAVIRDAIEHGFSDKFVIRTASNIILTAIAYCGGFFGNKP